MKKSHDFFSDQAAFTLLEMLVVIVIFGILVGLLVPTFGNVREKGRRAICSNNLRQIGIACHLYVSDHGGRFPTWGYPPNGCDWFTYGGKKGTYPDYGFDASQRILNRYVDASSEASTQALSIFHCASDIKEANIFGYRGTAFDVWGTSYLMNMFILSYQPDIASIKVSNSRLGLMWDFISRNPGHGQSGTNWKTNVLFVDGHIELCDWPSDFETVGGKKVLEYPE